MRIVKDKDGSERILTEDEYQAYKSKQDFNNFVGELASVAHSSGGISLAVNVLLFGFIVCLYLISCITGEIFQPETSLVTMLLAPVLPIIIIWYFIRKFPWFAVLLQIVVVVAIVAAKVAAEL